MKKVKIFFTLLFLPVAFTYAQVKTFCNPINIDYGFAGPDERHAADPVIVLFKDKYYLFDTDDMPGYRVSDDLISWSYIKFDDATCSLLGIEDRYTAPAVSTDGKYIYFVRLAVEKEAKDVVLIRTDNPQSGSWTKVSTLRKTADPTIIFDKVGFISITV
jgi:xylan 1,4-beta-xylosidase